MNKSLLFLLLFLLSHTSVKSQEDNFNIDNLRVSQADLDGTVHPIDSTANAFYIYEKGLSRFKNGGSYGILTDYAAKMKVLNKEGFDHANIEIPLYKNGSKKERIKNLKATTYYMENGQGKTMDLPPGKVYTEENETYDLVKFTFPAISSGSVLVYSYEKESPFIFKFETWRFQDVIPKLYSQYETKIPGNYNYNIKKTGEQKLDINHSEIEKRCFSVRGASNPADCIYSTYAMKDIPAFIEEPYLTSKYNYISRIEYELMEVTRLNGHVDKYTRSWKDVDKEIRTDRNIGKQLKRTSLVKNLLPDSIQQKPNNLLKAQEIFHFVKENYKWNGEYGIFDMNLKDLLKDRSGNVSSVNILLHNIYKNEGFSVAPILSSVRSRGFITKLYPVLSEFNYLMLHLAIEDEEYILDATEKYGEFGQIPYRGLNRYGRLLKDKSSSWINIEPEKFSQLYLRDSIKVNANGTSTGHSEQIYTGYHALRVRNDLDTYSNSEIFSKISNPNRHTTGHHTKALNKELVSEPLQISHEIQNESQKINNLIYFNPFSFLIFEKNPLQLEQRSYPIDFGFKDAYSYSINVEIPENHEVLELPEQKRISLPEKGGSIHFMTQQTDEQNVMIQCRVTFSKAIYSSGYYPYLKEFFNTIVDLQNESLIVIKENN